MAFVFTTKQFTPSIQQLAQDLGVLLGENGALYNKEGVLIGFPQWEEFPQLLTIPQRSGFYILAERATAIPYLVRVPPEAFVPGAVVRRDIAV
jgi:hypothetical protein